MTKIRAAVLGCTGLVGQQFVRLLDGHPLFELAALFGSPRTAGRRYGEAVGGDGPARPPLDADDLVIQAAGLRNVLAAEAPVVFSALPAACARELESGLRDARVAVFTNASPHRMSPDVPILAPEINPGHLRLAESQKDRCGGFIVAGSNCSTAGLALALAPFVGTGIRRASVATYQSISGAGRRGLAAWEVLGNVVPYIAGEEEKMERELGEILGTVDGDAVRPHGVEVQAHCFRVPVREGHLLAVTLDLAGEISLMAATAACTGFLGEPQRLKLPSAPERPLVLRTEPDRPQPALDVWAGNPERARGMAVTVGRLRLRGSCLSLTALVHNTVRGAAGQCVLAAELAQAKGLLG